jgi:hypothetical protein
MGGMSRIDWLRAQFDALLEWANANWKWLTFLCWLGIAAYFLSLRSESIHWFALGDTDDNMRYLQVRDWINGQGWYDLRQYRLNPPEGANIHWSRIVDLPLAGLMLLLRLFLETGKADALACGIAPLLPLLPLMLALGFITRRVSDGSAWIIAVLGPLGAPMGLGMFVPLRVDHHGWQLTMTVTMLAGIVDPKWVRGGIIAGLASAISIAIGMEMMVYLAGAGGIIGLRWVFKDGAARRLFPYAVALGGGTATLFLLFASTANRQPVCDALSPIWVAILGLAAAGMMVLTWLPLRSWPMRLAAASVMGGIVGAYAWMNWPQCFAAYQISPELQRLWLVNIREAKPITSEAMGHAVPMLALPLFGALGALVACFTVRRDAERLWAWGTVALMTWFALALMFWQIRAAPAAQLLSIPAAAWAGWAALITLIGKQGSRAGRIAGGVGVLAMACILSADGIFPVASREYMQLLSSAPAPTANSVAKSKARAERMARIRKANGRCRTQPALAALDVLPPATIFTLVDLGPRLIATTHHSAIAGPYHRNGDAILDIHHAFDGTQDDFRRIAQKHGATYLLFCPDFPEGTVYQARSPQGFYARLSRGTVPAWLHPMTLTPGLPYTLYRIEY